MKKTALILSAALVAIALPASADDEIVRSFKQQIPVGNAEKIALDFPVGEVTVEAWDNPQVNLEVKIACKEGSGRCRESAKALRLVYNGSGDQLRVQVKNWPKMSGNKGMHVIAKISVPRDLPLSTDLGVGELNVEGLTGDVSLDLGVGEVNVTLSKESVRSVSLDTGIGEASLVAGGRHYESAGLIAREIKWHEGKGNSRVSVDCGVGEIDVNLK